MSESAAPDPWIPTHRHYKGGLYRFITHACATETDELFVVYEDEQKTCWARPAKMFYERVADGRERFEPLAGMKP